MLTRSAIACSIHIEMILYSVWCHVRGKTQGKKWNFLSLLYARNLTFHWLFSTNPVEDRANWIWIIMYDIWLYPHAPPSFQSLPPTLHVHALFCTTNFIGSGNNQTFIRILDLWPLHILQRNLVYVPFISLGMELLSMEILLQCSLPALDPATVSCAVWIAKISSNVSSYLNFLTTLHKIISYKIFFRSGLECSEACKKFQG